MSVAVAGVHVNPHANANADPFRKMLGWSAVMHVVLFALMMLAGYLGARRSSLPIPEDVVFISLGSSGPDAGTGGGAITPEPEPPPPEPAQEPEPEPARPEVVRPTEEQRELVPEPDAPKQKQREERPTQESGLRGADAASAPSDRLRQPGGGLPGLGLGGSGGGSPFDQDFEYSYYVQQMLTRIHQHWQRTPVRGTTVVVVRFTILRNGSIQDAEVEQSSGFGLLDRGALRAVILSDPMPPLPNSYPRDRVGVHLRFTYSDRY
jgi:protein TonB